MCFHVSYFDSAYDLRTRRTRSAAFSAPPPLPSLTAGSCTATTPTASTDGARPPTPRPLLTGRGRPGRGVGHGRHRQRRRTLTVAVQEADSSYINSCGAGGGLHRGGLPGRDSRPTPRSWSRTWTPSSTASYINSCGAGGGLLVH